MTDEPLTGYVDRLPALARYLRGMAARLDGDPREALETAADTCMGAHILHALFIATLLRQGGSIDITRAEFQAAAERSLVGGPDPKTDRYVVRVKVDA
jgi:hypothetical protein